MLSLTKQDQEKQGQENLDQPLIKVCGRKPQPEKQTLHEDLLQVIAATPGYEGSSEEELAAISEGLLEFASIAYSIYLKDHPLNAEEDEDLYSDDPLIFKEAVTLPEVTASSSTKSKSIKSKKTKSKSTH